MIKVQFDQNCQGYYHKMINISYTDTRHVEGSAHEAVDAEGTSDRAVCQNEMFDEGPENQSQEAAYETVQEAPYEELNEGEIMRNEPEVPYPPLSNYQNIVYKEV